MIGSSSATAGPSLSALAVATRASMTSLIVLLGLGMDIAHRTTVGSTAGALAMLVALLLARVPREPLVSIAMVCLVIEYAAATEHLSDRDRLVFASLLAVALAFIHSLAALTAFAALTTSVSKEVALRAVSRAMYVGGSGFVTSIGIGLLSLGASRAPWLGWTGLAGAGVLVMWIFRLMSSHSTQ